MGSKNHINPNIPTAISTVVLPANINRTSLDIQNNSAVTVAISFEDEASLTSITPSNSNPCATLAPGQPYNEVFPDVPTGPVTIYQASGGTISSISIIEG